MDNLSWLAGLLEAEGSFLPGPPSAPKSPRISMATTDEDVAKSTIQLLGSNCIYKKVYEDRNWSPIYSFRKNGKAAIRLMEEIYPAMGIRRQNQIVRAIGYQPFTFFEYDFQQWLIGLLEGEGTFLKPCKGSPSPMIRLFMTDKDIVLRVADMWKLSVQTRQRESNRKTAYSVQLTGKRAVDLMLEILPSMSQRRQKQIMRATEGYNYCSGIGEDHPNAKFTIDDVRYIKSELLKGERGTAAKLAREFGVNPKAITWIKQGRNWSHVET